MAIDPTFQLRLGIYDIEPHIVAARQQIWDLLEPELGRIVDHHIDKVNRWAPYYNDILAKTSGEFKQLAMHYTRRFFTTPFDEQWVEDAKVRAGEEARLRVRHAGTGGDVADDLQGVLQDRAQAPSAVSAQSDRSARCRRPTVHPR